MSEADSAEAETITGETNIENSKNPEMSEPLGEFLRVSIIL
jgi:hypothetical protein